VRAWLFTTDEAARAVTALLAPLGYTVARAETDGPPGPGERATLIIIEWVLYNDEATVRCQELARNWPGRLVVLLPDTEPERMAEALATGASDALVLPGDGARLQGRALAAKRSRDPAIDWADTFLRHPLPTFIFDADTLAILAVNQAMVRAYGWSRDELLSMTALDLRPISERARFEAFMSDTNRRLSETWIHHRKDGSLLEVEISTRSVAVAGHRAHIVVAEDVSERERAFQAHRRERFDYRRFFERTPDAVFTYAPDGSVVDGNPAFVAMLGEASLDTIIGRHITEFIHPDDHAEVRARMKTTLVRQAATVPGPIRFLGRDGAITWTEARGIGVTYAAGPAVTVVARDLSERRLADEALRLSEERFSKIFHASPACISVTRAADDCFIDVNGAFLAATGYAREEIIGRTGVEIGMWESPLQRAALGEITRSGETLRDVSVRLLRKSGEPLDFLLSVETFTVGGEACMVALGHDVTERNRLEEQLRQTQKMEAIGLLAGGVAHDFNNLLTAMRGYCEILLPELALGTAARDAATHIHRSTLRAASLTGQLLALTRRQPHQPKVILLNDVVTQLGALLGRIIGEDITLELRLCPELGCVRADATQIEQVLLNLAVNGRDAMERGGKLIIETANERASDGDKVRLSVRDTGRGMSEEVRRRVFEPFFTTKDMGTGLGLSIVSNIVSQNGGSIRVESAPGQGAAFHILLPRVEEAAATVAVTTPKALPVGSAHQTILLVEDDEDVREFVAFVLRRAGYEVLAAQDGTTALRAAGAHAGDIDVLLTDVIMPQTSGVELVAQLKPTRPHMKVLHMSGYPGENIARHGRIPEGAAFLQKPFSTEELVAAVQALIDDVEVAQPQM
jgi:PAS domain S-box-containing protein